MTALEEHRDLLVAVAYRVVGTITDAEDVVQDAWLRWKDVDPATVTDVRGYLVTVTTRLAIDRPRRSRARRESYVGPWLPEPVLTGHPSAPDIADAAAVFVLDLSPCDHRVTAIRIIANPLKLGRVDRGTSGKLISS
jgi:DNA-directed RNA polymerase specialized sigma24 family protein